ncbi:type IV pili methyl-accepting chemotaxis transducer N-terminal domain-containing protein [Pseudotamlana carrageenivorans]|uniref:NarX-like N-terminal domain-containing protein n=1 Tax=Pseudotamlana carrageenivorans TaxID=2069432 RepID=A0A2I7SI49_9FLAO|nr:type IV pili methyl-accepting chemotaxis transducer N-terminal domain-containing protein [Tamlana carrageenivorans]AUS05605.1 hypothetical protein C1A40_09070 [Tamlana carrageenivorans]
MNKKPTILNVIFFLFFISLALGQSQTYGDIDYNKAINISGKQRMLSQKMAKAYLLKSQGITNDMINKELNASKFIFEKQLEILKKNSESSSTRLYLKQVNNVWDDFKKLINQEANTVNALRIMSLNTELLKNCHQVVLSIERSSNYNNKFFENNDQELINTINVSGKQRMLSQRMCLYFAAINEFPKNKEEFKEVLGKVFDEFSYVIGDLLISTFNTTEIEEEIGLIMALWEPYQSNKRQFLNGDFDLIDVYNVTNELTKRFNKVTGLFEQISKKK